jgi:hypothetical protein
MAINWNQAEYVAPKLQIVPEQLPVEAGVKVGAVLQDRFDKSYENLTKSEEALRQMALNANEVDRPEVERIYNQYSEQLKGIDKTDLHNARWKTLKLATEAANNYMSVAQKNKEIKAQEEMISKNPIYQFSKEARLKAFKKGLPSIGWDAEKRTFTNLNVTPYAGAADVNIAEVAAKASSMMKPTDFGEDVEKITYYDAENKVTTDPMKAFRAVTTDTSKRTKTLTPEEIRSAVGKYLSADAGVNAMLNRDYSENLELTGDPEKDELIKQQYRESLINPALDAAGALFRINDSVTGNKIREGTGFGLELAKAGYGQNQAAANMYSPNNIFETYGSATNEEFPDKLSSALSGNAKAKSELLSTLDGMSKDVPEAKEAKNLVKDIIEFGNKYPEYANMINRNTANLGNFAGVSVVQKMFSAFEHLSLAIKDADKDSKVFPEGKKLVERYRQLANKGFFDSKFEDAYEKYAETNPSTRELPLVSFDISNDKTRSALDKLKTDFNIDKFETVEGEWKSDSKKISNITGFTIEPYGAGTGIVFELEDEKGNRVIASPKKQDARGILSQINKIYPEAKVFESYIYKDIIPITRKNSQKPITEILEDMPKYDFSEKLNERSKGYSIKMNEDGTYSRITPQGEIEATATSMYKLLPKISEFLNASDK